MIVAGHGDRRGGRYSSTPQKNNSKPQDNVTLTSESELPSSISLESLRNADHDAAVGLEVTAVGSQEELGLEESLEQVHEKEIELEEEPRWELELEQNTTTLVKVSTQALKTIRHNVRAISTPEQIKISKMANVTFEQKSRQLSDIKMESLNSEVTSELENTLI